MKKFLKIMLITAILTATISCAAEVRYVEFTPAMLRNVRITAAENRILLRMCSSNGIAAPSTSELRAMAEAEVDRQDAASRRKFAARRAKRRQRQEEVTCGAEGDKRGSTQR